MLGLHQRLAQQQKLSPQQIQYQKLLMLNTMQLEQRIKTELEMNPLLEEVLLDDYELTQEELSEKDDDALDETSETEPKDEGDFSIEDFMNDADMDKDYFPKQTEEEIYQPLGVSRESLAEHLIKQLHMLNINDDMKLLGEYIINSLDQNGFFKAGLNELLEELSLFENVNINPDEAVNLLHEIQKFDPVGIAAKNSQESLLIQLKNLEYDPYYSYLAEKIIENFYNEFLNKKFDLIQKELNISHETFKLVYKIIAKLDPKPGEGNIESPQANQITPDFIVEKIDGNWVIYLNDKFGDSVTINQNYEDMLRKNSRKRNISPQLKETHKFLREKFESAKWFLNSIKQRKETLLKIMRAIVEKQNAFFDLGPIALKPMKYQDIAEDIQMDVSTISRVVRFKYVESPMGIHELKYFFSEGLKTETGEDISNKKIKEYIKEIILNESKTEPYSDDKIAEILNEKGIMIARRTVAKYREHMRIPVARLRKEL